MAERCTSTRVSCGGLGRQPLAAYLGALGLLRMVGTQLRTDVRGAFSTQGFSLEGVERDELLDFVLTRWAPSAVLTPWNNASGFYPSSKGNQAREALGRIVASQDVRFAPLAKVIRQVHGLVHGETAPADVAKAQFIGSLRSVLPDHALTWLDAVSVVIGDEAKMMPLLGSGGNEGVLDYSGLYLRSLSDTLLQQVSKTSRAQLSSAIFGDTTADLLERPGGQFDPGTAGGFNTGPGFETKGLPNNPWSFILLVEGTMVWASGLASRQQGQASGYPFAASPFTVRHVAAGYGSAGRTDDSPSKVRAEIWMPVWDRPASLREVERFLGEGRVEVGGRGGEARRASDSLDFAEAVASLGVDRGVRGFVRYTLTKRRGDAYIALPTGALRVEYRTEVDLLRQLDGELALLDGQFMRRFPGDGPPALLVSLRRNLNDARFDAATRGGQDAMLRLVRAIGALERVLAARDPGKSPSLPRPLGGLSPAWVTACGESTEVRLAAAIAGLASTGGTGSLRSYLAPVDPKKDWQYLATSRSRAWFGATLAQRLASVLSRRLLDVRRGSDSGHTKNPTWGPWQVTLDDMGAFLEPGTLDEGAIDDLIHGFTWVRHRDTEGLSSRPHAPGVPVPREYSLLKLLFLPSGCERGREHVRLSAPAEVVPLLMAGRIDDAITLARRTLVARGFLPRRLARRNMLDADFGALLAAAMLIPMFQVDRLIADALLPNTTVTPNKEKMPHAD